MTNDKFKISKGPADRLTFLASFAEIRAVEFTTGKVVVKIKMLSISLEDGSGFKFIFEGYDPANNKKVQGYYNFQIGSGWFEYK